MESTAAPANVTAPASSAFLLAGSQLKLLAFLVRVGHVRCAKRCTGATRSTTLLTASITGSAHLFFRHPHANTVKLVKTERKLFPGLSEGLHRLKRDIYRIEILYRGCST